MKNKASLLLRVAITVGLIGVIIWQLGGAKEILNIFRNARIDYIVVTFFVITLDRFLMTFKWILLLKGHKQNLRFIKGVKIYCSSQMWGLLLPSTMGADAIRTYISTKEGVNSKTALSSIIIERMVGFIASLILGLIALIILNGYISDDPRFMSIWWGATLLFLAAIFAFSISFSDKLFDVMYNQILKKYTQTGIVCKLQRLHQTYLSYKLDKKLLVIFFLLTFFEQIFSFIIAWLIALSLNVDVGILFMAGVIPLALLVSRLPISVDGIGVFEAIFIFFMALVGVPAASAVAIAFAARILQIVAWTPWWILYMLDTHQLKLKMVQEESI